VRGIALERLSLAQIDASLVEAFLDHLANDRHVSIRTQNHRLAALHAFFRYVQAEVPERLLQSQQILAIPLRRHARPSVGYLTKEYLAQILAQPDLHARAGRRDAVLLSVLYDTGARVQELIDLNAGDVRLESPAQVRLMGKGRDHPGFTQPVSPHSLRHTKGMHLLQSGVPLEIIRDFLGHVDVKTTEIYARANLEMKRKALEKVADVSPLPKIPSWKQNKTLLEWLHSL
jgi:site-specific recombinase XerD